MMIRCSLLTNYTIIIIADNDVDLLSSDWQPCPDLSSSDTDDNENTEGM